jgi:hypothetical protein
MKNYVILIFCIFFLTFSYGQCPMCKMSAEADLKNGGSNGKGLNAGIVYMLTVPYILMGTIGFLWYRERRKIAEEEQKEEISRLLDL